MARFDGVRIHVGGRISVICKMGDGTIVHFASRLCWFARKPGRYKRYWGTWGNFRFEFVMAQVLRLINHTRGKAQKEKGNFMLGMTLMFLIIALVAGVLGFAGIAGTAAGIAQICFVIFLVLFLVSLLSQLLRSR